MDRVNGLEGVQVDIVMMRTPDGHGRLELTKFRNPKLVEIEPAIAPPNTLGLRSVMFTVESVDDTVAHLRAQGAKSIMKKQLWSCVLVVAGMLTTAAVVNAQENLKIPVWDTNLGLGHQLRWPARG